MKWFYDRASMRQIQKHPIDDPILSAAEASVVNRASQRWAPMYSGDDTGENFQMPESTNLEHLKEMSR